MDQPDIPVVILRGGQGTRIREVSERLSKGMVEIGGRPRTGRSPSPRPALPHLVKVHDAGGCVGTVTGVHPTSKFGEMQVDGDLVAEFNEKPTHVNGWVSGGYFVVERSFLDDYLNDNENLFLEAELLQQLARDQKLTVNMHEGFWVAMDTYKDYEWFNRHWATGKAPWKLWTDGSRGW
jgi:glucose-1-phosphate cytidylyltransferase